MWLLSLLPFVLQTLCILFDEAYFHVRRGLPRWERIGHPIDTLSVLFCMGFVLFIPFSKGALVLYLIFAALSSLLVTKDEFVHKKHCSGAENWLHAVLFVLHPIVLASMGLMWPVTQQVDVTPWIAKWLEKPQILHLFLKMQFAMMALFLAYQIVFWNILWKNKQILKQ